MPSHRPHAHAAARKQILLGLLADAEHERLGLPVEPTRLAETTRWYRARFDLVRPADMTAFLEDADLRSSDFAEQMRTFHHLACVQEHYHKKIEGLIPRYRAVFSIRDWILCKQDASFPCETNIDDGVDDNTDDSEYIDDFNEADDNITPCIDDGVL